MHLFSAPVSTSLLLGLASVLVYSAEMTFYAENLLSARQSQSDVVVLVESLPSCGEDEYVTFNGSQLICNTLPMRQCNCPEVLPDPPEGCQRFAPPSRGGFVCLRTVDTIYCSVLCDNTSEFSGYPVNPYRCGPETDFLWVDFTERTYKELPLCNGFRLSFNHPLFPDFNYLLVPCSQLTEEQEGALFGDFVTDLQWIYQCFDCETSQAYIQCPPST